jgi:hypothetical protein
VSDTASDAVSDAFSRAVNELDEESFQLLYGRCEPLSPQQVADLFAPFRIHWFIAGGRAARVGAEPRHHEDLDVAASRADLAEVRRALAGFHLWEANSGSLRPLLPGTPLSEDCEQFWVRRDSEHPWQLDLLLDRSGDQWVFKRDPRVRLPWDQALHTVDGLPYLRPELALLHKAHLDRPKDRADLAAARLDPQARDWLVRTLELVGEHSWARALRS